MILLTYDWHPFFTYEWWRDIGMPLVGAVTATLVGVAALVIAGRSHGLAQRATDFAKAVQAAEDQRAADDKKRERRQQRADFALLARRMNAAFRDGAWGQSSTVEGLDLWTYESHVRDTALALDDPVSAEYLIDRIVALWSEVRFPSGAPIDGTRRREAGMNWRMVDGEIRNYMQELPMSKPHWREQHVEENEMDRTARGKTEAWRAREAAREAETTPPGTDPVK